jgi:CTP synthase (UTP-ammonia lyase)
MHIIPATIAYQAYGKDSIIEKFQCNYGLNEKYRNDFSDGILKITGYDEDDNARIIEIPIHRFFIATLFLPQFTSKPGMSHPLILSFIKAAIKFRDMK